MSAPSTSPNKEATVDDKENPHLKPLNPQNQENPQLILDEKGQETPTADANAAYTEVSVPDSRMMSPANTHKRKKGKKGKGNTKKLQAIEKKHEKLLRRLGLWDFLHMQFDRNLRLDFIAQLIATYDSKLRASYVNDFRIADKGSVSVVDGMDLDVDPLSEELISFLEDFVSIWVLLHKDTWIMPNEVLSWTKAIKDGHPEKLIKSQRKQVLFGEEPEKVEFEVDVKDEDECGNEDNARNGGGSIEARELDGAEDNARDGGPIEARELDGALQGELNIELTLGQDPCQKQEVKDVEMMDVEELKDEKEEEEEEKQWLSGERADANEPLLQRCKMQEAVSLDNDEEKNENHELANDIDNENDNDNDNDNEEEDEGAERHEVEDGFDVMPSDDTHVGVGLMGNLLQTMESTQIAFTSRGNFMINEMHTGGPFFGSGSKREIEVEPYVAHHSLNGSNKRLRIDGAWDEKPLDFGSCMEQMQQLMMKAWMMYEAKEQNEEQININQQIFLKNCINSKCEEIQKRDGDICCLERELFMMGNILDGYRKALMETQKQFSEYRKKFQLPEEPYYKDAGPGGLMLSAAEMEKLCLKQEEETRSNCFQFENFIDKVQMLDKRLMGLEDVVKDLRNMSPKSNVPESEDKISETLDCPLNE
ncbi:unnamed protein product [Withania somnifera]